jgi:hypothetical protein
MLRTVGEVLGGIGLGGYVFLIIYLPRHRTPQSAHEYLESWLKIIDSKNYTDHGRRLLPLIWVSWGLLVAGVALMVVGT